MEWRRRTKIETELRANRPEPSDAFMRLALGKVSAESGRPRRRGTVTAFLLPASLVGALIAIVVGIGGFSAFNPTLRPHYNPFAAANVVYAAPTVSCSLTSKDSGGHLELTFTTNVLGGSLSGTISSSPLPDSGWPTQPVGPVTITASPQSVFTSTGGVKESSGHTYTANLTYTVSGYATATATCSHVGVGK